MSAPDEIPESQPDSDEKELCLSCMFPNDPNTHFCSNCRAPMSSYAATGPFERILAEGHVYRQAAERPRKLIVVLGVWLIFVPMAIAGVTLIFIGRDEGLRYFFPGVFSLVISVAMILRTTISYFKQPRMIESNDSCPQGTRKSSP